MTSDKAEQAVSVGFISLGCAKNLVDSQIMAAVLLSEGLVLGPAPEESDVVIVNTCAFIDEAREESTEMILSACELKKAGPCRAVLVTGCMPQRYRADMRKTFPDVDAFIGLDELEDAGKVIRRLAGGQTGIVKVSPKASRLFEPRVPGIVFTGGPYAYLKVSEGCNHRCAFCAIPDIRGALRSRPVARLVKEAEQLLAAGIRELNLVSQDVTSYGRDLADGTTLPRLIRELAGIGGTFWIRLLYGYPSRVTGELLRAIDSVPQICSYLDIPIQHSHPDVLRAMGRGRTVDAVARLADRVRARVPDIVLRTTCLLGYPGETEAHVRHLVETLRRSRFDHVGAFVFSPEEHTRAIKLDDRPPREVAEQRRAEVLQVQREIVDAGAAQRVGTEAVVLLEQPDVEDDDLWIGRSAREAPEVDGEVLVRGVPDGVHAGSFIRVRYTAQADYDMTAKFLSAPSTLDPRPSTLDPSDT